MGRKVLLLALVLAGLIVAGVAYAQFYAPTVEEVLTETPLTEGAGGIGGTIPAVMTNESEENNGIPEWLRWSTEEFEKLQKYINETEIEIKWTYNANGEKIRGEVIVDGKQLHNGLFRVEERDIAREHANSAYKYFTGERKGHCRIAAEATYKLFKLWMKDKNVRLVSADNIDYNLDYPNGHHYWVEWTDDEGEWVSDYGIVWPKEYWYQRYNWTVNWRQEAP